MALPANVDLVTVTGTFHFIDATDPDASTVEFRPSGDPWLKDAGAKAILLPKTVVCTINPQGQLVGPSTAVGADGVGVKLPAADDPDLAPNGWVYDLTIKITGLPELKYSVSLTTDKPTVDLAELAPVSPVEGGALLVTSVNGKLPNVTGAVVLTAADVGALPVSYTPPPASVLSVSGKTGAVTLTAADVGALPVDYPVVQSVNGKTGSNISIGAAEIGALPTNATAADVGALPDTTTAADIGAIPVPGGTAAVGQVVAATQVDSTGKATAFGLLPATRGARTIVIGDSIDAQANGWYPYFALGSKTIETIRNAGIGGNTTTQMLARIQADVLAYSPDVVILGAATNNFGGGAISETVTRSDIATMVGLVRSIGAIPILRTTPPNDVAGEGPYNTITLRRQAIQRHNGWIFAYAASQGIDVLDVYQAVADPTTGGYQAGITVDGTHPTEVGYKAIADYLLALPLPGAVRRGAFPFARAVAESGNMLVNGVFTGDANADGLADGWVVSGGTPASSLTAATTGITGNWQRITASSTAAVSIVQDITTGYATGDVVQLVGRINTSGTSTALVRLTPFGSAQLGIDLVASTTRVISGGVFSGRLTIPSDLTKIRVLVQNSTAAGWIEVAEVALRNLTTLGLA